MRHDDADRDKQTHIPPAAAAVLTLPNSGLVRRRRLADCLQVRDPVGHRKWSFNTVTVGS
ncbi:hypothetical protein GCM10023066_12400 [Nocardioides kongjuensis]